MTDITSGVQASWDNKAIQIIEYIVALNGRAYTYVEIANELNMAVTEVGRYLREAAFERRSWEWAKKMRKYKPKAYMYYLNNSEIREVTEDGETKKLLYVNFSKHDIFLMNCRLRNVEVMYQHASGRKLVYLFERDHDARTSIYYEVPSMEHEDLYNDLDSGFADWDDEPQHNDW